MKLTLALLAAAGLLMLAGCPKEPTEDAWKNPGEAQPVTGADGGAADSSSDTSTDAGGT